MRLEAGIPAFVSLDQNEFLFQTGAIRREVIVMLAIVIGSFYSKLVRLEESAKLSDVRRFECFYSKLVRLEANKQMRWLNQNKRFLFQTGAIRSQRVSRVGSRMQGFYSKLVRLEVNSPSF